MINIETCLDFRNGRKVVYSSNSFRSLTPFDCHKEKAMANMAIASSISGESGSRLDVEAWLPEASKHYCLSKDIRDFVIVPVPAIMSDVPNTNGVAMPKQELLAFNTEVGRVAYKTWKAMPCITGDTLVSTDIGIVPMKDIQRLGAKKVLSKDGTAVITDWMMSGIKSTVTVSTKQGKKIKTTEDHRFLVLDTDLNLVWVEAKDLVNGDKVIIRLGSVVKKGALDLSYAMKAVDAVHSSTFTFKSKTGNEFEKPKHQLVKTAKFPSKMSAELARILGYLISEGCTNTGIIFCNTDKDLIDDYCYCWKKCFGEDLTVVKKEVDLTLDINNSGYNPKKKWSYYLNCGRADIFAWLREIGLNPEVSGTKTVPSCILQSSNSHISEFLKAYIEGDGSISGGNFVAYSKSRELLQQIKLLLETLGFTSTVKDIISESTGVIRSVGLIRSTEALGIMNCIGTVSKHRTKILAKSEKDYAKHVKNRLYTKGENLSLRIPNVKNWAIATVKNHTNGGGRFRKYYDTKGNIVDVSINMNSNQGELAKREYVEYLSDTLGMLDKEYKKMLKSLLGNFVFDEISEVVRNKIEEPVYDITTSTGMFAANGIIVHNCFREHANQDISQAKGVILDSYASPVRGFGKGLIKVMMLAAYDRSKDPVLANAILAGEENAYSMGAYFSGYNCSICGQEKCRHTGPRDPLKVDPSTQTLAYRNIRGIKGFELSSVASPAYIVAVSNILLGVNA